MTGPRIHGDAGQAFPIYITVVAGLLFLAFAFLAVGQAAANRNGAQTAADAAALAAALDTRDKLTDKWVENVLDPTKWQDIFDGVGVEFDGCARADELAAQNDATTVSCRSLTGLPPGYSVEVRTNKTVGDSIVPGVEGKQSTETAAAVIEPVCEFQLPGEEADVLPKLTCQDGGEWSLDPEDLTDLPGPEDLFDVHLAQANDE
ncbi:pilus assembly protein TadG-related protein [Streptomyces sp. NRRL B-24085]|uniref:pilus assembly protein TadG-related protein n=1 Tax=Streptomyces sp. NRRL B-24085 TaxID=1709476 RepID=UPI00099BB1BC|nr:pilus assembly protein TadG-related protein [Streptomyces sp. NRRL B-24085]